jgi:hypothetical protein
MVLQHRVPPKCAAGESCEDLLWGTSLEIFSGVVGRRPLKALRSRDLRLPPNVRLSDQTDDGLSPLRFFPFFSIAVG